MALTICRECKAQVSSEAKVCPRCGAKPLKQTPAFVLIGGIIAAIFVIGNVFTSLTEKSTSSADAQQFADFKARAAKQAAADREAAQKAKRYQEIEAGKGPAREKGLGCAEDTNTHQFFCFDRAKVRSNGDARAFSMLTGGSKTVTPSGYTAVIFCESGVMELRDRQGIVFARDRTEKLHTVQLREQVCSTTATPDSRLR